MIKPKEWYKEACKKARENLNIANIMATPEILKVVINTGLKESVSNSKVLEAVKNVLAAVSNQSPVVSLARKSIAGFKIRDGMPIGAFVTLRRDNMYSFLYKLISLSLPRVRDFNGVGIKFDNDGNYNIGIKDFTIFPEAEKALKGMNLVNGVNVSIVFKRKNQDSTIAKNHSRELLTILGMPFVRSH